ncbi:MAG: hypothetical protein M1377_06705 [Deltaproteobacteria bacterium]|nr:hypothetical protein [Deltaproteobacteria bacterium]
MPDLFSGGFGVTPDYLLPRRILSPSSGSYKMPFYLFEFMFTSPKRYTDTDLTVVWSGNAYNPVPISVAGFEKSSLNFAEVLTIKAQNVDREISAIILNERIQGKEASIYASEWMAPGSFSNPTVIFKGQFDGANIEEGYDSADVSMEVRNEFVKWDMPVPRSTFAGTCQWKFKSDTPDASTPESRRCATRPGSVARSWQTFIASADSGGCRCCRTRKYGGAGIRRRALEDGRSGLFRHGPPIFTGKGIQGKFPQS